MSDNKKVIHVKDLVIKAENVRIEPAHRPEPYIGKKRQEIEDDVEEGEDEHRHYDDNNKPPFSWI